MFTAEDFRRLALDFPDAYEEPHFHKASFRVAKKIFATMAPDGSHVMVKVTQRERLMALLESMPAVFFDFGGFTERNGALGVRLEAVEPETLRDLLTDSYLAVAPKRAVAALQEQLAARG